MAVAGYSTASVCRNPEELNDNTTNSCLQSDGELQLVDDAEGRCGDQEEGRDGMFGGRDSMLGGRDGASVAEMMQLLMEDRRRRETELAEERRMWEEEKRRREFEFEEERRRRLADPPTNAGTAVAS